MYPTAHVIDLTDQKPEEEEPLSPLPKVGEPAEQTTAEPVKPIEQPKPGSAEQVAIDFDVVAGQATPTATTNPAADLRRGDINTPYDQIGRAHV